KGERVALEAGVLDQPEKDEREQSDDRENDLGHGDAGRDDVVRARGPGGERRPGAIHERTGQLRERGGLERRRTGVQPVEELGGGADETAELRERGWNDE